LPNTAVHWSSFLAAGYEIQITELDFIYKLLTQKELMLPTLTTPEHETDADQAKFVKKLMQTIINQTKES